MHKSKGTLKSTSLKRSLRVLVKADEGFAANVEVAIEFAAKKVKMKTDARGYAIFEDVPEGPVLLRYKRQNKETACYLWTCCNKTFVVYNGFWPLKSDLMKSLLVVRDSLSGDTICNVPCEILSADNIPTGLCPSSDSFGNVAVHDDELVNRNMVSTLNIRIQPGGLDLVETVVLTGVLPKIVYVSLPLIDQH